MVGRDAIELLSSPQIDKLRECAGATCSRADALPAGATWPAIAVTVDVVGNAASPQVNVVTVSGGGSAAAVASDSSRIRVRREICCTVK